LPIKAQDKIKSYTNIYCDESRYTNPFEQYFLIGCVALQRDQKSLIESRFKKARRESGFNPELKWSNVTEAKLPYLNNILQIFFTSEMSFRCIIIDKSKLKSHTNRISRSEELSFYKFYYLLLKGMLRSQHGYYIFLDQRTKTYDKRIGDLQKYLKNALVKVNEGDYEQDYLRQIQEVKSSESIFIQIADLFMGAVGYYWNGFRGSDAKLKFIDNLTKRLQKPDLHFSSQLYDQKWNQFVWEPKSR
jgi:hypothetical protein